jgi:hypothetical protein
MSWAIRRVTKGKYNHALIVFELDNGKQVYFESYWHVDKTTGKTGLRGPVPIQELKDWVGKKKKRAFVIQWMPYGSSQSARAYQFLEEGVKTVEYPLGQIVSNARTMLFGSGMRLKKVTPYDWTCSETCARTVAHIDPETAVKHLKVGDVLFDMIPPSGKHGLYEGMKKFMRVVSKSQ